MNRLVNLCVFVCLCLIRDEMGWDGVEWGGIDEGLGMSCMGG